MHPGQRAQFQGKLDAIMASRPELDAQIAICLNAWSDLSTCRAIGMALGPIPWTAIIQWAEFHELDRDATQLLVGVIRHLDNVRATKEIADRNQRSALGPGANVARGKR